MCTRVTVVCVDGVCVCVYVYVCVCVLCMCAVHMCHIIDSKRSLVFLESKALGIYRNQYFTALFGVRDLAKCNGKIKIIFKCKELIRWIIMK